MVLLPELLVGYRQVQGSMSNNIDEMNRSKTLALQRINDQYPQVYSTIIQWSEASDCLYLGKKYYSEGYHQQAWKAVLKAFQTDWAMTLCTLKSYSLVTQLLRQSIYPHVTEQVPLQEHTTEPDTSKSAPIPLNNRFLIKRYLTVFILLFFPDTLLQALRIRWIHSQICPERHPPQSVSLKTLLGARLSAIHHSYKDFYNGCSGSAHPASHHEAIYVSKVMRNE